MNHGVLGVIGPKSENCKVLSKTETGINEYTVHILSCISTGKGDIRTPIINPGYAYGIGHSSKGAMAEDINKSSSRPVFRRWHYGTVKVR